jgi:hypothetical protein
MLGFVRSKMPNASMYMMKAVGARQSPCGTDDSSKNHAVVVPLTDTVRRCLSYSVWIHRVGGAEC